MPILKTQSARTISKVKIKVHADGLPQEKTTVSVDPAELVILIVAPPGWGKTEFFASFPENLMLCCEEGHRFVTGFKIVITCWDYRNKEEFKEPFQDDTGTLHMSFMQAIEAIEGSDRYKFITIDTVDSLVKMILDFYYVTKKVDHASDLGDYGKGWDIAQNTPFRRAINRLIKTGRGLGLTTHEEVQNRNFKAGTRAKKETTLPNGVWKYLFGQLDLILHGTFGRRDKGTKQRQRLVVSEGSEDILAKNRGGKIAPIYICDLGKQFQQFSGFFTSPKSIDTELARYEKIYGETD
jgi:hypothetical protein